MTTKYFKNAKSIQNDGGNNDTVSLQDQNINTVESDSISNDVNIDNEVQKSDRVIDNRKKDMNKCICTN